MDVKWLEDFLSLARTGNFSQSARERNVTQPAFSRRIKALEHWLGVPLVDRSTCPRRLTGAGEAFLPTARDMLWRLHDQRARIRGDWPDAYDVLSMAAQHSLSLAFIPNWLRGLHDAFGPFSSRLVTDNFHECVQHLIEGHCHFLLCFAYQGVPYFLDRQRFPSIVLSHDRLVPVTAMDWNRRPRFRLEPGSASVPYLAYAPDSFLGRAVDLILQSNRRANGMLSMCYENSLAEALKVMAAQGHGVAWVPESTIVREVSAGQLGYAGDAGWTLPLEIRLYRSAKRGARLPETLWEHLSAESGAGLRRSAAE